MNKVITINLNGNAYQLDETGYNALRTYLEKAQAKLAENPDTSEIMADLEQAIADKCAKYISRKKSVVTTVEVTEILAAMGPVEDTAGESDASKDDAVQPVAPKRLYKIREGAVFEGVCNGIAAYAGLDVTVVRVIFIVLTILTGGAGIIAYILMAILIPEAKTAEDHAAANGKEFNSQTILASAHKQYQYLKESAKGKVKEWEVLEAEHKGQKQQWKDWKKGDKAPEPSSGHEAAPYTGGNISRAIAGLLGGLGVILMLAMVIGWVLAIINLFSSGMIFGRFTGESWLITALFVTSVFYIVFLPVQSLVADALRFAKSQQSRPSFWARFVTAIIWLCAVGGAIAIVSHSGPIREGLLQIQKDVINASHMSR